MSDTAEAVIARAVQRLRSEEGCHTIILYGSHARGDAGPDSDFDLIAFRDREGEPARITGRRDGGLMDIFIYPATRLAAPDRNMLHVRGGRVIEQRGDLGKAFLGGLDALFDAGPKPLAADERQARRNWAWKMLDRAARGDAEGDYRRHWLLMQLLENHFAFQNAWYLGSKAAFRTLRTEQPRIHALFEKALRPGAPLADIEELVREINGPQA